MAITRAQQARQMLQDGNQVLGPLGEDDLQTSFVSGAKRLLTPGNIGRAAAFILSGGSLTAAEIAKEIAKQKVLNEARKKVGEVIGPRIETKLMQQQNEARGTGGYQSDFSQDSGFMGGSGTAAEMDLLLMVDVLDFLKAHKQMLVQVKELCLLVQIQVEDLEVEMEMIGQQ